jgi:Rrf2 family protein
MEALARSSAENPMSVRAFGESYSMSVKFLQSVVGDLSKEGLVVTKPGPKGGITLGKPVGAISVLDIVEAVEGPINLMECLEHPYSCTDFKACSIMGVMYSAQDALRESLRRNTLALMVKAKQNPFGKVPPEHFQSPMNNCPVIATDAE